MKKFLSQPVTPHWIYIIGFVYGVFILVFCTFTNIPSNIHLVVKAPEPKTSTDMDIFKASLLAANKWEIPYEILIGIANAESSKGTNFWGCEFSYNAWGVKPHYAPDGTFYGNEECNRHLAKYPNYVVAADDVARILRTKYFDQGLDTPEKIVKRYVGNYSESWIHNVKNHGI